MMNKKGGLVLRDMVFMMMIVSSIFVFAGLFVSDMAFNYENDEMANEWALTKTNKLANSTFVNTTRDVSETGDGLSSKSTGIWSLIEGVGNTLKGIGGALFMVLVAPNTISALVAGTLEDMGAGVIITNLIRFLIITILWGTVIFTVSSAFLRGGRV